MDTFEQKLYQTIKHNSLLFLEDGVRRIIDCGTKNLEDAIVMSCTSIQISLELALRAYLLRNKGLENILDRSQQGKYSVSEKEQLYAANKLKVIEFDGLKNQLKGFPIFKKEDYRIIDDFQNYRNKLVHFCCSLEKNESQDLREKLMYYVVRVVLCLLYDNFENEKPADYFVKLLGWDFYRIIWNDWGYVRAIEQLAKERSNNVGVCPICDRLAYSIDEEFCYFCNTQPNEGEWGRTDCLACDGKNTVVFDELNIHNPGNHHSMPGFCQICESHPQIFECPICGQTHWLYSDTYDWMCYDGHCTTMEEDY